MGSPPTDSEVEHADRDQVASGRDGRRDRPTRITIIWSPPAANDLSDRRWSLLALVDDLAALAADLYLRGRIGTAEEGPRDPDLGKKSDDQIV
jgi:hypothetical protein